MVEYFDMRKKWLIVLGLVGLVILGFFVKKSFSRGETEFKLAKVKKGGLVDKISASGKVGAERQVDLKFQTSGRLAWVGVKEGDLVSQWQTVAQLDTRELKRALEKELRDYMSERWDFEEGRDDYQLSTDNLDQYTLTHEVRRVLEKNQFDLDKAVADVELSDIALKYATLVTPIAGIVTSIDTPVAGVNITPATAVFTIADPGSVYFSADIDEADIGKAKVGQKVKLALDSFPDEEFESTIVSVKFAAIKTSGGGTAFPTKIALPENLEQKFKLGMNGDAEIIVQEKESVLYVPMSAVMEREEKKYVWVVEKSRATKKEIRTGLEIDDEVEVSEGLNEGETIISEGISKVKEGQKVE